MDAMCMEACQAMTGHGGWPLNAFLTPEQVPFFAGTYFPPEPRHGLPSWRMVLLAVADAWEERREEIRAAGRADPRSRCRPPPGWAPGEPSRAEAAGRGRGRAGASVRPGERRVRRRAEVPARPRDRAPAGPRAQHEPALATLARDGPRRDLRPGRRRLLPAIGRRHLARPPLREDALRQRPAGPRLPARLAGLGRAADGEVCCETLDWVLRELRGPEGGFCSALDADSEGEEGKFYIWTTGQLRAVLGELGRGGDRLLRRRSRFERRLRARGRGPRARARCPRSAAAVRRVRGARAPGLDDKRLTAWNALMISALAEAGAVLDRRGYLEAATARRRLRPRASCATARAGCCAPGRTAGPGSRPTWRTTRSCSRRCSTLYEASFEPRFYHEAVRWPTRSSSASPTPTRAASSPRPPTRAPASRAAARIWRTRPIPSGNSAAAFGLLRLALLSGEARLRAPRRWACWAAVPAGRPPPARLRPPAAGGRLPPRARAEVAIVGPRAGGAALLRVVRRASGRMSCWPAGQPTAFRCSRAASRSTAGPRPTCASTSPARRRSPSPAELAAAARGRAGSARAPTE